MSQRTRGRLPGAGGDPAWFGGLRPESRSSAQGAGLPNQGVDGADGAAEPHPPQLQHEFLDSGAELLDSGSPAFDPAPDVDNLRARRSRCPSVSSMPRPNRLLPALALVAVLLTACVPESPIVTPPPEPTATPVFASDEEALTAAEEAYAKYLAMVDRIFADGGQDPKRLLEVASEDQYTAELPGFIQLQESQLHGTGAVTFQLALQRYSTRTGDVTAYACDDVSQTDILTADGVSVVQPGRIERVAYEVEFGGNPMRVVERTLWERGGVCESP